MASSRYSHKCGRDQKHQGDLINLSILWLVMQQAGEKDPLLKPTAAADRAESSRTVQEAEDKTPNADATTTEAKPATDIESRPAGMERYRVYSGLAALKHELTSPWRNSLSLSLVRTKMFMSDIA